MRKTVVFILSSNFSGSHFLSLLLGSHSKAAHLGEVKNLVKIKNLGKKSSHNSESSRQCYVCEEKPECIITSNLHGLQKGDIYSTLFSRHEPSITHLIDASKKSEWANNFISNPDFNIKFIHLVRDPRALVRKWDLHYNAPSDLTRQKVKQIRNFPSKLMKILWFPSWQTYLLKWLDQNRTIFNFITSSGHDYQTISYEELATDTEKTLAPLMDWL
ncbi:MAG: sulfotransferase, partial [Cycloclasticus sp.]|nr:sulfotransferase [Cycloclasticus sp.]